MDTKYEVGVAPMGCYVARVVGGEVEVARVGIKSYATAVKVAAKLNAESRNV